MTNLLSTQFFYPSTEWSMAQPFDCLCGTPSCRGRITGARDMPPEQLEGVWLNRHIRDLLEERDQQVNAAKKANGVNGVNGASAKANGTNGTNGSHATAAAAVVDQQQQALRDALAQAERLIATLRQAAGAAAAGGGLDVSTPAGAQRRGPTSRELAGEEGGDTIRL
jgi:hypothetical protein